MKRAKYLIFLIIIKLSILALYSTTISNEGILTQTLTKKYPEPIAGGLNQEGKRQNNHQGCDFTKMTLDSAKNASSNFNNRMSYGNKYENIGLVGTDPDSLDLNILHTISNNTLYMGFGLIDTKLGNSSENMLFINMAYKIFIGNILENRFNYDISTDKIPGTYKVIENNNINFNGPVALKNNIVGNLGLNIYKLPIDILNNTLKLNFDSNNVIAAGKVENLFNKYAYLSGSATSSALFNTLGNIKNNTLNFGYIRIKGTNEDLTQVFNTEFNKTNTFEDVGITGFFGSYFYITSHATGELTNESDKKTFEISENKILIDNLVNFKYSKGDTFKLEDDRYVSYDFYGSYNENKNTNAKITLNVNSNGLEFKNLTDGTNFFAFRNLYGAWTDFKGNLNNNFVKISGTKGNIYYNSLDRTIYGAYKKDAIGDMVGNYVQLNGVIIKYENPNNSQADKSYNIYGAYSNGESSFKNNYIKIENSDIYFGINNLLYAVNAEKTSAENIIDNNYILITRSLIKSFESGNSDLYKYYLSSVKSNGPFKEITSNYLNIENSIIGGVDFKKDGNLVTISNIDAIDTTKIGSDTGKGNYITFSNNSNIFALIYNIKATNIENISGNYINITSGRFYNNIYNIFLENNSKNSIKIFLNNLFIGHKLIDGEIAIQKHDSFTGDSGTLIANVKYFGEKADSNVILENNNTYLKDMSGKSIILGNLLYNLLIEQTVNNINNNYLTINIGSVNTSKISKTMNNIFTNSNVTNSIENNDVKILNINANSDITNIFSNHNNNIKTNKFIIEKGNFSGNGEIVNIHNKNITSLDTLKEVSSNEMLIKLSGNLTFGIDTTIYNIYNKILNENILENKLNINPFNSTLYLNSKKIANINILSIRDNSKNYSINANEFNISAKLNSTIFNNKNTEIYNIFMPINGVETDISLEANKLNIYGGIFSNNKISNISLSDMGNKQLIGNQVNLDNNINTLTNININNIKISDIESIITNISIKNRIKYEIKENTFNIKDSSLNVIEITSANLYNLVFEDTYLEDFNKDLDKTTGNNFIIELINKESKISNSTLIGIIKKFKTDDSNTSKLGINNSSFIINSGNFHNNNIFLLDGISNSLDNTFKINNTIITNGTVGLAKNTTFSENIDKGLETSAQDKFSIETSTLTDAKLNIMEFVQNAENKSSLNLKVDIKNSTLSNSPIIISQNHNSSNNIEFNMHNSAILGGSIIVLQNHNTSENTKINIHSNEFKDITSFTVDRFNIVNKIGTVENALITSKNNIFNNTELNLFQNVLSSNDNKIIIIDDSFKNTNLIFNNFIKNGAGERNQILFKKNEKNIILIGGKISLGSDTPDNKALGNKDSVIFLSGINRIVNGTTIDIGPGKDNKIIINQSLSYYTDIETNPETKEEKLVIKENDFHLKMNGNNDSLIFAGNDLKLLPIKFFDNVKNIKLLKTSNAEVNEFIDQSAKENNTFKLDDLIHYNGINLSLEKGIVFDLDLKTIEQKLTKDLVDKAIIEAEKIIFTENITEKITLNARELGNINKFVLLKKNAGDPLSKDVFKLGFNIKSIDDADGNININVARSLLSIIQDPVNKIIFNKDNIYSEFINIIDAVYNNMFSNNSTVDKNSPQYEIIEKYLKVFNYYDNNFLDTNIHNNYFEAMIKGWLPDNNGILNKNIESNIDNFYFNINDRLDSSTDYTNDYIVYGKNASYNYFLMRELNDNKDIFNYDYTIDKSKRNITNSWFKLIANSTKIKHVNSKIATYGFILGNDRNYGQKIMIGGAISYNFNKINTNFKNINNHNILLGIYSKFNFSGHIFLQGVVSGALNFVNENGKDFSIEDQTVEKKEIFNINNIKAKYNIINCATQLTIGLDTKLLVIKGFANIFYTMNLPYKDNYNLFVNGRKNLEVITGANVKVQNIFNIGNSKFKFKPQAFAEGNVRLYSLKHNKIEVSLNEFKNKFLLAEEMQSKFELKFGGTINLIFLSYINFDFSYMKKISFINFKQINSTEDLIIVGLKFLF